MCCTKTNTVFSQIFKTSEKCTFQGLINSYTREALIISTLSDTKNRSWVGLLLCTPSTGLTYTIRKHGIIFFLVGIFTKIRSIPKHQEIKTSFFTLLFSPLTESQR